MNDQLTDRRTNLGLETLKVLASRRLAATPDNYRAVYAQLSRRPAQRPPSQLVLERLVNRLRLHQVTRDYSNQLSSALQRSDWGGVDVVMGALVSRVIRQLHAAQKVGDNTMLEQYFERGARGEIDLQSLPPEVRAAYDREGFVAMAWLLGDLVQEWFSVHLAYAPTLAPKAGKIVEAARRIETFEDVDVLGVQLADFLAEVHASGERLDQMFSGLLAMVRLIIQHAESMGQDDQVIGHCVDAIDQCLQAEMTPVAVESIHENFRQFLDRQAELSRVLEKSKVNMARFMQKLMEQMANVSDKTGEFSQIVTTYANRLNDTQDLSLLPEIVQGLLTETESMHQKMSSTHQELEQARAQVIEYQNELEALKSEVKTIKEMAKEDQLTGLLNRRGLSHAFAVEGARCKRKKLPLSVALLDLDNFKRLNDQYGHQAGDQALVHLSNTMRQMLRPTDIVARFGGEEFVILFPETKPAEAVMVVRRVQKGLADQPLNLENTPVVLSFSAGVTVRLPEETQDDVFSRADQAMYRAKRAGKNRVELGSEES